MKLTVRLKGGSGSGHHGHAGRPGKHGGSAPGTGGSAVSKPKPKFSSNERRKLLDATGSKADDFVASYRTSDAVGIGGVLNGRGERLVEFVAGSSKMPESLRNTANKLLSASDSFRGFERDDIEAFRKGVHRFYMDEVD